MGLAASSLRQQGTVSPETNGIAFVFVSDLDDIVCCSVFTVLSIDYLSYCSIYCSSLQSTRPYGLYGTSQYNHAYEQVRHAYYTTSNDQAIDTWE